MRNKLIVAESRGISFLMTLLIAGTMQITGCSHSQKQQNNMETMTGIIQMECKITKFTKDAMHDQYDDGGFAVFHATELEVLSPEGHNPLTIYHNAQKELADFWKQAGQKLRFNINASRLKSSQIFTGALSDIEAI